MPELPLVETYRGIFNQHMLHKRIQSVTVPTLSLLVDLTPQALENDLVGQMFSETHRHGKFLFCRINSHENWMVMHFGLFGTLRYADKQTDELGRGLEIQRLILTFEDASRMGFENREMRGGRVWMTNNIAEFLTARNNGPDAFDIDKETFVKALWHRDRKAIKAVLMDQSWMAGVGNLVADEVLYQCKIHSETKIVQLDKPQLENLYTTLQRVLKTMVAYKNKHAELPEGYLLRDRRKGRPCTRDGTPLVLVRTAGRQTVYCPQCQVIPIARQSIEVIQAAS